MKMRLALLLVFLLAPGLCLAQSKRVPVAVSHSGEDQVGRSFAFALKEAIRRSQSFILVDDDLTGPRIIVRVVSVDGSDNQKGASSAIALAVVYDSVDTPGSGILLDLVVKDCGSNRVEACAKRTLPNIDEAVGTLRKSWPALWKLL